jgi:hypothetical protein
MGAKAPQAIAVHSRQREWARLPELSKDEAFEIVGFRHAKEHRVVAALHPFFDNGHVGPRINRRVVDDFRKGRFVDVVRAAAGHENPISIEQLQRTQVDFLVTGCRFFDGGSTLREGGRIEHDRVEAFPKPLEPSELVEDVACTRIDDNLVGCALRRALSNAWTLMSKSTTVLAPPRAA